jgi:PPOX class probable F420-dependent enzyme
MPAMTDAERDAFLAKVRLGSLATLRDDGSPVAVPVWFEWDGAAVRCFTSAGSGKVRRLQRDPRASLLVVNNLDEPEAWVAFDGEVTITREGAIELAERLARRYWDLADPAHRAELETWRKAAAALRVLELIPKRIRTSSG